MQQKIMKDLKLNNEIHANKNIHDWKILLISYDEDVDAGLLHRF